VLLRGGMFSYVHLFRAYLMDFPLALPERCRGTGSGTGNGASVFAYGPLSAAANSRSKSASPPTGRKRAAVLATVKMLWGGSASEISIAALTQGRWSPP
jgi:hypothetical protein